MFIIEKNIPIPQQAVVNRKIKYPFADMEIGDSFFVPGKTRRQLYMTAKSFGKRWSKNYVLHDESSGVRIWRVG